MGQETSQLLLSFYDKGFEVESKDDGSPLTNADLAADACLQSALKKLTPEIPIVSEESSLEVNEKSAQSPLYWIIDPLDGTRGFIRKNGHFCVNIALMENHKPLLGVIALPTENEVYVGHGTASFKIKDGLREAIYTRNFPEDGVDAMVGSTKAQHDDLYESFFSHFKVASLKARGGASKFCYIARGDVDLYIRFSKCYEWDVAAGHAIVEAAGGIVQNLKGGTLNYGDPQFVTRGFMVFGQKHDLPTFS
ncbi:3'(2'),5'-bisphosphate nucleotidase CysQ [Candidatus Bealeia paramacronuclearis]|uniref:3'(2'),5'-bisphosphate nucleotidase n=1 Tax=Candidatus Bealeia paramacronuclearis TaxID=1921001 RepID=A0ABZ2C1L0_9PROT|nr:3'(2'),5'-bisphosphate nucleotidase CysQ [Candidatus Bealeia paramacronuclearis]